MVVDEVCHTPTATTSAITLSMSKTFFSRNQQGWKMSCGVSQR
jgi:hypothetical protein